MRLTGPRPTRAVTLTKPTTSDLADLLNLEVGAYAGDAPTTRPLSPSPQRRAMADKDRHRFTPACAVIIGDTTHYVAAGHHAEAAIVAVATGNHRAEELSAAGADALPEATRESFDSQTRASCIRLIPPLVYRLLNPRRADVAAVVARYRSAGGAEARRLAVALLGQAAAAERGAGPGPAAPRRRERSGSRTPAAIPLRSPRGHVMLAGQPGSSGGQDAAPTPMELLVAALGSCVAFYAGRYLVRHGLEREGLYVTAEFAMAAVRAARVGAIWPRIVVPGGAQGCPAGRGIALHRPQHPAAGARHRHQPGVIAARSGRRPDPPRVPVRAGLVAAPGRRRGAADSRPRTGRAGRGGWSLASGT
jgi:hypothetical protein